VGILQIFGNVFLGKNKGSSWNPNHLFIRPTTSTLRQTPKCFLGNVSADDGEITRVEFKEVRTAGQTRSLIAICVRIRPQSAEDFHIFSLSVILVCYEFVTLLALSLLTVKLAFAGKWAELNIQLTSLAKKFRSGERNLGLPKKNWLLNAN
jgi:hypothetical protein